MSDLTPSPAILEPLLPEDASRRIEDLAVDLFAKSGRLASQMRPEITAGIGALVRSMNCYYSNLIEGHHTHPRDIERALHSDFSKNPEKRALQLEAKAHIDVQTMIDNGEGPANIASPDYICWIHHEFCRRMPAELLHVENPDTGKQIRIVPGELRDGEVVVGRHIPPNAKSVPQLLQRISEGYDPTHLSKVQQAVAVAALHHRLLWVHPFYDGNGRVARLLSHAYLRHIGIGSSLWSVSRGLARRAVEYKSLLMQADMPRRGDLDGRGNLTASGLTDFCAFFLESCIDQVEFMETILEPHTLLKRMERYVEEMMQTNQLPKGSFALLREALLAGSFERGQSAAITGYKERQARTVLSLLVEKGLLESESPKGAVHLGFPSNAVEYWFPRLYPTQGS